jgi:hypothetical protein
MGAGGGLGNIRVCTDVLHSSSGDSNESWIISPRIA